MFERRLKIILLMIALIAFVLILRAGQIQVLQREMWTERATETMKRSILVETIRGRILDIHGRPVAVDAPCIDACVDFRAIGQTPDEKWVADVAARRLAGRVGYTQATLNEKKRLRLEEAERVKSDLVMMWQKLARISGVPLAEIEETRQAIVSRVELRRRYIAYRNYERARQQHETRQEEPSSLWKRWLIDETQDVPELKDFVVTVAEENEAHIILRNVGAEAQVELGKYSDRYPGLVLRPSTYRYYPYANAGCHLIGRLSRVDREDLKNDPNGGVDELRQYQPNDLIGRTGVEALAEPLLRGGRGRVERVNGEVVGDQIFAPGKDVRLTIDIELQQEIQQMFSAVAIRDAQDVVVETVPLHGAAVVIDIATNGVRALASYPDFDPNRFDKMFPLLSDENNLDKPLLNRATQSQLEPGSTVKPMVGLAAIANGLITPTDTIECTGYLIINGKIQRNGRCWVASKFHDQFCPQGSACPLKYRGCPIVKHHFVPGYAPHPTGMLTFSDALERSCNVYFETLADRLGSEALSSWYSRFGLGRPTGIGITEAIGRLPTSYVGSQRSFATWSSGIGQGPIAATPLQMANVVATIARNGIWERPRLVEDALPPNGNISKLGPARVDLNIPPAALKAAKEGMVRVVNSLAGTGKSVKRTDVLLACKTGTAQAASLSVLLRDDAGKPLRDPNGRYMRDYLELSTMENPNPRAPWYRGTGADKKERSHSWLVGFAPAQNPRIAFAVMIEYGGSGGGAAGEVAKGVIEACVEHGYLPLDQKTPATPAAGVELLHDQPTANAAN